MKNKKLKTAMYEDEVTHKEAAELLGINTRTFTNKINKRVVNGYQAGFTIPEKALLALQFNISVTEIE